MSAADMLSGLHPVFARALRPHLALPTAAPLMTFTARCGQRPVFRSIGDVKAYERGFRGWPDRRYIGIYGTPMANGWMDRECEHAGLVSCDQTRRDNAARDWNAERAARDAREDGQ